MNNIIRTLVLAVLALTAIEATALDRVTYYHNDALGSPVAATDHNGNLLWRESYEPYGERLQYEDNAANELWYTGKQEEREFGINYFGARWYDPTMGRFLAIDPVGFNDENIQSFNRYAYANNNPYLYVDPDGEYADLAIEVISIGIGLASFKENLSQGNFLSAAIDGGGVLVDGVLVFLPLVPGGTGIAIKAGREGAEQAGKQLAKNSDGLGNLLNNSSFDRFLGSKGNGLQFQNEGSAGSAFDQLRKELGVSADDVKQRSGGVKTFRSENRTFTQRSDSAGGNTVSVKTDDNPQQIVVRFGKE